ncbi:hypothetical protein CGLAMM_07350 [Acetobacteraceae bacterium EV16G]|uniref:Uncharacterized protein n=1 Tax=Sorlinia euscelidii TaxID=3081148 RepID=A0ABU7U4Q3_9PROT
MRKTRLHHLAIASAIDEVEPMDSDGTDRLRVTYEFLHDLMRLDDNMRGISVRTLAKALQRRD